MSRRYTNYHETVRPLRETATTRSQTQPGLEIDARVDTTGLHKDFYAEDTTKHVTSAGAAGSSGYFPDEHYAAPGLQAALMDGNRYDGRGEPHQTTGNANHPAEALNGRPNRRRLWMILVVIAAILIILGAVLGGVLGSRAANAASSDEQAPSSENSNETRPVSNISRGSRLAVTGWREGAGYYIRLFYQGPDQQLRFSNYSTAETDWYPPVVLDQMEYAPRNNTSLAASTSLDGREGKGEFKVFYVDQSSILRMHIFPSYVKESGVSGRLNTYPAEVAPNSRIGAYWPSVASQEAGPSGMLRWTQRYGDTPNQPFFKHSDANVTASAGSGLAIVPAASKDVDGASGWIYRRGDGKVFNRMPIRKNNFTGLAWDKGDLVNDLNDLTIPAESPLAAFTVRRLGANPDNFVNTYILYVGSDGAVNMIWQDDNGDGGWKGPQTYPEAFGGADRGTDVTCLTPATWDPTDVRLEAAYDMSRCYFQADGGRVREVRYDGSTWLRLGDLPI
ncbi:hypothetical protein PG997_002560 [Apiospora hydei]|uniref:Fucose-specific lectin n=1 Tax=Apiospora hydei TaxID=1337664 RepID=A0ABR1WWR7_9PEZI